MSWEQGWPLEGVTQRMGVEEWDWVVKLKEESLEALATGVPAMPMVLGGGSRGRALRVGGRSQPMVLVMCQATWAGTSGESCGGCLNKGKQQASLSPSPGPLKRAHLPLETPSLASSLHLSLAVFSLLSGQSLDIDVGALQEHLD